MRVEQLEYLAAVTRLGSLRRASEELHLSQPALSETLRNLERELGVVLLERRRSGARISDEGRELLPHIAEVLDAVDRLRQAADEQHQTSRRLRLGTVNAATVTLLAPAIREFRATHPSTQVEVIADRQDGIQQQLKEGSFDLGLISYLGDDAPPPSLHTTELLRGRPVVCVRPDSPLATLTAVTVTDLLAHPLIVMRSGYAMHRYIHQLLRGRAPSLSYSTDGAEMCKLMVAEGLGATVLPDYSVLDDPLERSGTIICRPLAGDDTELRVVIQRRHARPVPTAERDLHAILVRQAARRRTSRTAGEGTR
ncbi:LysR family transcriptional regulator [Streptomyces sp. AC536]|uniref:LysR family transcriptional regulator n=1 Tax=Streptomyces buecherae TaxID=2763006 RepID=UPI00164CEF9B|nr:LysR family transcriptional regulator [Streptomyces buecherae]MBC3986343.1 LysR family transcriptional regulator [Streptomyces buecherae]QNJ41705.1 LysR family transcriptional regulator [Streptomyces buecherae]